MSVKEPGTWITGDDISLERRHLRQAGLEDDSPEAHSLWKRVDERDDYLWERYAKPLIESHFGEWAAVSIHGEIILAPTSLDVHQTAREKFGPGNFVYGKLAQFRGIDMSRC